MVISSKSLHWLPLVQVVPCLDVRLVADPSVGDDQPFLGGLLFGCHVEVDTNWPAVSTTVDHVLAGMP